MSDKLESRKDETDTVKFWKAQLSSEKKVLDDWRADAKRVIQVYRDEKDDKTRNREPRFNILWSNIETMKPAVYSKTPNPDVRRRFADKDPVARQAALVVERALSFTADDCDFDKVMEQARDDYLLISRGHVWICYDPTMVKHKVEAKEGKFYREATEVEPEYDDDDTAKAEPFISEKVDESCWPEYVFWEDFRYAPFRQWKDVWWVARRHTMTRDELIKNFKALGKEAPLNASVKGADEKDEGDTYKRAWVWEIWDKSKREVVWISEGFDKVLKRQDDPLNLRDFFPCPEPLLGTMTNDTPVPIPEYSLYQDQAQELQDVTARMHGLIAALKVRGVFAGEVAEEISNLLDGDENELIPVTNWAALMEKGGLDKAIAWLPIERIIVVVSELGKRREQLKQEIYELTGISDIIRGATKASETATAQRIKGTFGSLRLEPRKKPVSRFARDVLRLLAEIIAEHYSVDTLKRITGVDMPDAPPPMVDPQVFQAGQQPQNVPVRPTWQAVEELLRADNIRRFRVDIETDSTVQPDEQEEKQQTVEFVQAITGYFKSMGEITAQTPALAPLAVEMLGFAVRRFKVGRTMEEKLDEAGQAVLQMVQAKMSQPQTDPKVEALKMKGQIDAQNAQAKMQMEQQSRQGQMAMDQQAQQGEMALAQQQAHQEMQLETQRAGHAMQLAERQAQHDAELDIWKAQQDAQLDREKAARDAETARMTAMNKPNE